nr:chymase-like [Onthophagus taurus]
MKFFLVYVFILAKVHGIGRKPSLRIVAGFDCNPVEYPFYALVIISSNKGNKICGGSLVAPNFVLTAAHCCVENDTKRYNIQTGTESIDGKFDYKVNVTDIYIHAKYDPKEYNYDACMLKLHMQICKRQSTDYLDIAFFDYSKFNILTQCSRVISAGFGVQHRNERKGILQDHFPFPKKNLQCTLLTLLSNKECSKFWKKGFYNDTMLCAIDPTPRKSDVCYGDSGGPLMCGDIQIGIISYSRGCGFNNTPGVFTKVSKIKDFILNILKDDYNYLQLSFKKSLGST